MVDEVGHHRGGQGKEAAAKFARALEDGLQTVRRQRGKMLVQTEQVMQVAFAVGRVGGGTLQMCYRTLTGDPPKPHILP